MKYVHLPAPPLALFPFFCFALCVVFCFAYFIGPDVLLLLLIFLVLFCLFLLVFACLCTTQVHISEVPDDEVFKICLEFYHHFSQDLYQASRVSSPPLFFSSLLSFLFVFALVFFLSLLYFSL